MRNGIKDLLNDQRIKILRAISPKKDLFYLVGGAIRDSLLGEECCDLDFCSPLRANAIIEIMSSHGYKVVPTGISFETITVVLGEDIPQIQISSFRGSGSSLLEDLSLRDFSINSLAVSIDNNEIIDPQGGTKDIANKIIRANGEPSQRFEEDPLRILRLVRLASELDFNIEAKTEIAARTLANLLKKISIERLTDEFIKIVISKNFRIAMGFLKEINFYEYYLPELHTCINFEQNEFHKHDVFEHTLDVIELCEDDKLLKLAALFHDIGKPPSLTIDEDGRRHFYLHEKIGAEMMPSIGKSIRLPNDLTKDIQTLVLTHMRPIDCGDAGIRRIIRDTDNLYSLWRKLKWADTVSVLNETEGVISSFQKFDERTEEVRKKAEINPFSSLAVRGQDLIELGFTPSRKFKDILTNLNERIIENPDLNTRDQLLSIIKNEFGTDK
jgi:tRNA nucleotidyltransferase (CCA-adding enzyme)